MPCTANAMSRCMTKTPMSPPTMPSIGAGEDRVLHEPEQFAVVLEVEHPRPEVVVGEARQRRRSCAGLAMAWCEWWWVSLSGTPTTTTRPPVRSTSTGVPYSSVSTSLRSTSSGVPSRNWPPAR